MNLYLIAVMVSRKKLPIINIEVLNTGPKIQSLQITTKTTRLLLKVRDHLLLLLFVTFRRLTAVLGHSKDVTSK